MAQIRKPFQGVGNIIRFNWHFYLFAGIFIVIISHLATGSYRWAGNIVCFLIAAIILISLVASFYIYDLSNLYKLNWVNIKEGTRIINSHAGFDETSHLLHEAYPLCDLTVLDFYDPEKHTEVSIKRARNVYPAYPDTQSVNTNGLPLKDDYADTVFLILSGHEIRNEKERIVFFKELNRVLNRSGRIIVVEHLRDWPNWFAYNIGFFHFLSASSWYRTFKSASLGICAEKKITPFITLYTLQKNGDLS